MFEGNWTCSGCGGDIKTLPFDPKSTENLKCLDCFKKGAGPRGGGEKKTFQGDWNCSECNADIKTLPFEPRETNNLKCVDCFKKSKGLT